MIARWAGDEFVVLLSEPSHGGARAPALGPAVAERIRSAVHRHNWARVPASARSPTVSIGVATGHGDLDSLFAAADDALYRAKRQGRNRVETYAGEDNGATR